MGPYVWGELTWLLLLTTHQTMEGLWKHPLDGSFAAELCVARMTFGERANHACK